MSEQGRTQDSSNFKEQGRKRTGGSSKNLGATKKRRGKTGEGFVLEFKCKKMHKVGSEKLCSLMDLISSESTTWCGESFFFFF